MQYANYGTLQVEFSPASSDEDVHDIFTDEDGFTAFFPKSPLLLPASSLRQPAAQSAATSSQQQPAARQIAPMKRPAATQIAPMKRPAAAPTSLSDADILTMASLAPPLPSGGNAISKRARGEVKAKAQLKPKANQNLHVHI